MSFASVISWRSPTIFADATSKLVCPDGLYHALARPMVARLAGRPAREPGLSGQA